MPRQQLIDRTSRSEELVLARPPAVVKKSILRDGYIDHVADYILKNNGPDENGHASPLRKRVDKDLLRKAILRAEELGLPKGFKLRHFWNGLRNSDRRHARSELIVDHIDDCFKRTGGDLVKVLRTGNPPPIEQPFVEAIGSRTLVTPIRGKLITSRDETDRFALLKEYFTLKGVADKYSKLRRWHVFNSEPPPENKPQTRLRLTASLVKQVLEDTFAGDVGHMIRTARVKDFKVLLREQIAGHTFELDLQSLLNDHTVPSLVLLYLKITKQSNKFPGLAPIHFGYPPKGTFAGKDLHTKLLTERLDQLLNEKYDGSVGKLLSSVTREQITEPIMFVVGKHTFPISMFATSRYFKCNVHRMLCEYLTVKGLRTQFEGFLPHHCFKTSNSYYSKKENVDIVLKKLFDGVCQRYFDGNLDHMIGGFTSKMLDERIPEVIGGHTFQIKTGAVQAKFSNCNFALLERYLQIESKSDEYPGLRPYHCAMPTKGSYADQTVVDEIVLKKFNWLVEEKFQGNLGKMLNEASSDDIECNFPDSVGTHQFTVSFWELFSQRFELSRIALLSHYISLINRQEEFAGLRAYHLTGLRDSVFEDRTQTDEIIKKKFDHLLRERFEGDLDRLIREVTFAELYEPFTDMIGGYPFKVSFYCTFKKRAELDRYKLILEYLRIVGKDEEYKELDERHVRRIRRGLSSTDWIDVLLVSTIENLSKTQYDGDLKRLMSEIRAKDLVRPFLERFGDHCFIVKPHAALQAYELSPWRVLKRYYQLKNLPFPYTRECFAGPTETRLRRIEGNFSQHDFRVARNMGGRYSASVFGLPQFVGREKQAIREITADEVLRIFGDQEIRVCTLETEEFESLRSFNATMNIDFDGSLIVERDLRRFNAMKAMQDKGPAHIRGIADGIEIVRGDLAQVLTKGNRQFNLFNLDFTGYVSKSKLKLARWILDTQKSPNVMVVVTLNVSPLSTSRMQNQLGYQSVDEALGSLFDETTSTLQTVEHTFVLDYEGGTDRKTGTSMIVVGILIKNHMPTSHDQIECNSLF